MHILSDTIFASETICFIQNKKNLYFNEYLKW